MPSELKQLMAGELGQELTQGSDLVVVGHTKMSGVEMTALRKRVREGQGRMRVVKNTIAGRVLDSVGLGEGRAHLDGPSAIVTGDTEMPALCKLVRDLAKEYDKRFFVRGGVFEGAGIDAVAVARLADIPPMPVLQAQIIGSVYAQLATVASAFQSISRSLACVLEGIRKKKEEEASSAA